MPKGVPRQSPIVTLIADLNRIARELLSACDALATYDARHRTPSGRRKTVKRRRKPKP